MMLSEILRKSKEKVKLSLYMLCRHMGEWRYGSTHS